MRRRSPAIADGARGVFLGYDFHLSDALGPQLIEINTNAGGGAAQRQAAARAAGVLRADSRRCCRRRGDVEAVFVAMFREEWRASTRGRQR